MIFARRVFLVAGVYGILALVPMYFFEDRLSPPLTHPEHFYGFVGVALAWQVLFLILSRDPVRYRPMMVPAVLEKLAFGVAVVVLFLQGRVAAPALGPAAIDLMLAGLFGAAYWRTASDAPRAG